ncbi:Uncharacterised protein [Burkholderia pseudomallei]|nr:hypothetical protein DO72_4975 [Burkholderia pseudomallei]CAJ7160317.1 Uncharacterised protein [Burkholderia pseudomallei]CAJ7867116.1 Uncharacterised protein [Burkholderia pseudomallei]CAJ8719181.1 Uncharacterised protein [Burkholderia pseudomallei]
MLPTIASAPVTTGRRRARSAKPDTPNTRIAPAAASDAITGHGTP